MKTIFCCPVCRLGLVQAERSWACANGHTFDTSREGYVNLLLANQKRSPQPGDNAEMVVGRRAFLDARYYDPLRDKLTEISMAFIEIGESRDLAVLDVGCGEGFYVGGLQQHFQPQPVACYGIDISKDAVRAAARRYKAVQFAVAGTHHLPVVDQRVDLLLSVFAPRAFAEFARVLAPDGLLMMVTPGPRHLWGLKQWLYDHPRPHEVEEAAPVGFELQYETSLQYEIVLAGDEAIGQLLSMTPYAWQVPAHRQQAVLQQARLTTDVDFSIRVFDCVSR